MPCLGIILFFYGFSHFVPFHLYKAIVSTLHNWNVHRELQRHTHTHTINRMRFRVGATIHRYFVLLK